LYWYALSVGGRMLQVCPCSGLGEIQLVIEHCHWRATRRLYVYLQNNNTASTRQKNQICVSGSEHTYASSRGKIQCLHQNRSTKMDAGNCWWIFSPPRIPLEQSPLSALPT
jgi:hypothetical protein